MVESTKDVPLKDEVEIIRFTPEEEAVSNSTRLPLWYFLFTKRNQALLLESHSQKAAANQLFASSSYNDAIETYNQALNSCPNYLDYEIAVLKSNIAACHLNLQDWKAAVKSATEALGSLDKLKEDDDNDIKEPEEEADEEIVSEGAAKAEKVVVPPQKSKRNNDIDRIRAKALMRRARARAEAGGWSSLQGAEEGMLISVLFEV